jgi:hypothetical protein
MLSNYNLLLIIQAEYRATGMVDCTPPLRHEN